MPVALAPVQHCLVTLPEGRGRGQVRLLRPDRQPLEALVKGADGERWWPLDTLRNGFQTGDNVHHDGVGAGRASYGDGRVVAVRTLAGSEQLLVQFVAAGDTRWLPFQHLRWVMPTEVRLERRITGQHPDHAERFRLRVLAKALENWDANTGAFGRLDIDPLPHQLQVAQRVITSEASRWLIADDVGLGKTIEVGLILHALEKRSRCRRVLIVCPANLVQQWKDEMRLKFDRVYEIYGTNFSPETLAEMRLRDRVIVSIDLAKREEHMAMMQDAGPWDVIIFDEAHRLGRSDSGERTDRYRLAEALRDEAPTFLLLTATPHQGKTGRFAALLELVRPDLTGPIRKLELNPSVVGEIVIRNQKPKVTDASGKLLFRGHDTQRITVRMDAAMRTFVEALGHYLTRGYGIAERKDSRTRAVGFVMTTYRKLASSSIAAIEAALRRRHARLRASDASAVGSSVEALLEQAERAGEDALADLGALFEQPAFFEDELQVIDSLLQLAGHARSNDAKIRGLITDIVAPLIARGEALLIFTEYRATQDYLVAAITAAHPDRPIELINGSMALHEKISAVARFNARTSSILISTEAGAEGLNLHRACHVLVNYDLPWNPSRLVQRIGRLYRYGQTRRVQVVNIQSDDGFDNEALALMLDRVEAIARDLAPIGHANREALQADILGELLSNIDMEELLQRAETMSIQQTGAEIEAAIEAARSARDLESSLLAYATEEPALRGSMVDARHMTAFVGAMVEREGGKARLSNRPGVLEVMLPATLVGRFPEFGRRQRVLVSADPATARRETDIEPLDFDSAFVRHLVAVATSRANFDGLFGLTDQLGENVAVGVYQVRWQDMQGELLEETTIPIAIHTAGAARMDDEAFAEMLLTTLASGSDAPGRSCAGVAEMMMQVIEREVADAAGQRRLPTSIHLYAAIAAAS